MKINRLIILIFLSTLGLYSCQKMDPDTETGVDEQLMWSNPSYIENYVVDLISLMPNGFSPLELGQGILYAGATDEAENANPSASTQMFNSGNWNSYSGTNSVWSRYYSGIYRVNLFLKKTDSLSFERFLPSMQTTYKAKLKQYRSEARLLRALFYYELLKHYGGVVLIGDAYVDNLQDVSKPDFIQQRATFEQTAQYIMDECDTITINKLLPLLDQGADQGRPNGTAAKAIKCKTLLLMASPVYNSSITEGSEQQRAIWKKVATVAQEICFDRIFSFGAYDVYDGTSPEVILGYRAKGINYLETVNYPVGCEGISTKGSTNPTQNLVDSYRMLNGKKIDEAGSGYDPANPYVGRDKRFAQTVIYNGVAWKERNVDSRTIQIYKGGRDGMDRPYGTRTGYYLKKFINPGLSLRTTNLTNSNREWPIFRFADIALIWAEAVNELYGPVERGEFYLTATTIVNEILTRHGGLPELPYAGISQEQMRQRIREERFVELAFEDQRAWDLRRWGIAKQVLSQPVYKMDITMNADSTFTYEKKKLEDRYFEDRMNLYPIPQRDVNNGLSQNTGW